MNFKSANNQFVKLASIPHFDQMTVDYLIDFFKGLDEYEFSEKIDGSQVSFGAISGKPYLKSKRGKPVTDPKELKDLEEFAEVFSVMGEFLEYLKWQSLDDWIEKTIDKNRSELKTVCGSNDISSLVFFGEILGNEQHNTIKYQKSKIENGAVVIFGLAVDVPGQSVDITLTSLGKQIISDLVEYLSVSEDWLIYEKKIITGLDLQKDKIEKILAFAEKNSDAISSRKRDPETKLKKEAAKERLTSMLGSVKKTWVKSFKKVDSLLGANEIEGFILRNKDGKMAKIVDLENFTAKNTKNWEDRKDVKLMKSDLIKEMILMIFKSADVLKLQDKQIQRLEEKSGELKRKLKSVNELLAVFEDDIKGEVELDTPKEAIEKSLNALSNFAFKTEQIIKELIQKQGSKETKIDDKHYLETVRTLKKELTSIQNYIQELKDLDSSDVDPFRSLIRFVIGPKRLEELKRYLT
jgi:hypothetical protein